MERILATKEAISGFTIGGDLRETEQRKTKMLRHHCLERRARSKVIRSYRHRYQGSTANENVAT